MTPQQRLSHKLRDGKYRARLAGAPAFHVSPVDASFMLSQTACYYCGRRLHPDEIWTLEHMIPLTAEDTPGHVLSNLAKSCTRCNELKHTMTDDEFREALRADV